MNPKIQKLKAEREKNDRKIIALKERNKDIDERITELENTDIIGMVREYELTPDMLYELICELKTRPIPRVNNEREESTSEDI